MQTSQKIKPGTYCPVTCKLYSYIVNLYEGKVYTIYSCLENSGSLWHTIMLKEVIPLDSIFSLMHPCCRQACLPSSCLSLLLGVYPFLNLCHIHYHSCHSTKRLQQSLIHANDYKDVILW